MIRKPISGVRRRAAPRLLQATDLQETEARLAWLVPDAGCPPARVKAALLARVGATRSATAVAPAATPEGWRFDSAQARDGWRGSRFPGVRFKTLSVDEKRDVVLLMIEMAPGARFPDHVHEQGGDEGVVLSGDVVNGGRLMRAGDYYFAAEGTAHRDTVSPSGCTALVSLTARAWQTWRMAMA